MARVRTFRAYEANGKSLQAEVDVTPSWWSLKRRSVYGPLAAVLAKFPYCVSFSIGLDAVSVRAILVKEPAGSLGEEIEKLCAVLEEMGSEWAERVEFAESVEFGPSAGDELIVNAGRSRA